MPDFWKGFKPVQAVDEDVYCIAHGSNLDERRMKARCPSAEAYGTSVINGYRLLFKRSMTGFYATIEQDANSSVPVVIYRMTAADEARLDRYEGYPKYYYKREFFLQIRNLKGNLRKRRRNCVAYIMHEYRLLGEPGEEYFDLLDSGYERWGFDKGCLMKAMEDSIGKETAAQWLAEYYDEEDEADE